MAHVRLFRNTLAVLFLVVSTASAQQLSEQITVNVVEVPVYVSRSGASVNGLTKDDFTLYVDGKPQAIEYFDVIENTTATVEGESPATPPLDRRRLIVLLFDLSESSFGALRRARLAADRFVAEAPPGDVFAVATLTTAGIRFVVPFVNDRVAVRRAVTTLRASAASDIFGIAMLESERDIAMAPVHDDAWSREPIARTWGNESSEVLLEGSRSAAADAQLQKVAEEFSKQVRGSIQQNTILHLAELADRLAQLSGIKHVVLLAENSTLPFEALTEATVVHQRFREAGVVLDAVDTGGLKAPSLTDDPDPFFSAMSRIHVLAMGTGGTVTRTLPQLREAQKTTYILGFRPPADRGTIRVRLRNQPPLTALHYRDLYALGSSGPRAGEALVLADVLMNDIPQNGLSVTLGVETRAGESVMTATVPGQELLALGNGKLELEMFIYVFEPSGQAVQWAYYKSRVDLIKGRDVLASETYPITSRVRLAPGQYVAKVLLRTGGGDAMGFARKDFVVD